MARRSVVALRQMAPRATRRIHIERSSMTHGITRPMHDSNRREGGRFGTQQRNKDRLGSNSGPMGPEDRRKDKHGSIHNQDPLGLLSPETQRVREELSQFREKRRRRHRLGSR
jgi:hypothetical protein